MVALITARRFYDIRSRLSHQNLPQMLFPGNLRLRSGGTACRTPIHRRMTSPRSSSQRQPTPETMVSCYRYHFRYFYHESPAIAIEGLRRLVGHQVHMITRDYARFPESRCRQIIMITLPLSPKNNFACTEGTIMNTRSPRRTSALMADKVWTAIERQ